MIIIIGAECVAHISNGKSVLLKLKESRFLCNDSDFAQWMSLTHPVFDLKMVKVFSLYQI